MASVKFCIIKTRMHNLVILQLFNDYLDKNVGFIWKYKAVQMLNYLIYKLRRKNLKFVAKYSKK